MQAWHLTSGPYPGRIRNNSDDGPLGALLPALFGLDVAPGVAALADTVAGSDALADAAEEIAEAARDLNYTAHSSTSTLTKSRLRASCIFLRTPAANTRNSKPWTARAARYP